MKTVATMMLLFSAGALCAQSDVEKRLDATRDYGHRCREGSKFGSHPSHDDHDEGGP